MRNLLRKRLSSFGSVRYRNLFYDTDPELLLDFLIANNLIYMLY